MTPHCMTDVPWHRGATLRAVPSAQLSRSSPSKGSMTMQRWRSTGTGGVAAGAVMMAIVPAAHGSSQRTTTTEQLARRVQY